MATPLSATLIDELHGQRRACFGTPSRLPSGLQPLKASHSLLPVLLPDKPTVSSVLGSSGKPRVMLGTAIRQRLSLGSAETGAEGRRSLGSRHSLSSDSCQNSSACFDSPPSECSVLVTELAPSPEPAPRSPDVRVALKRRAAADDEPCPAKRPAHDDDSSRPRQRISTNPNCRRSSLSALPSPRRSPSPPPLPPRPPRFTPLPTPDTPTHTSSAHKHSGSLINTLKLGECAKRKLQSLFKNALRELDKENVQTPQPVLSAAWSHNSRHSSATRRAVSPSAAKRKAVVCELLGKYTDGMRKVRFVRAAADDELGFHVVKRSADSPLLVTRLEAYCQIPASLLSVGDEILEMNRLSCAACSMAQIIALVRSSSELVLKVRSPVRVDSRTFAL